MKPRDHPYDALEFLCNKTSSCLLIDGESLMLFLDTNKSEFIFFAVQLPGVIAYRCILPQESDVARLIRAFTRERICFICHSENDVSMIQVADGGVGIAGEEGGPDSLMADLSIKRFFQQTKLLMRHGRNSYKRNAKLSQFTMHTRLVISVRQTMLNIASRFGPICLYKG